MNILIQTKYTHGQTCKQTQVHEYFNSDKTHTDKHVNKLKLMNILIQTKYTHRQTCKQTQAHENLNPDKIHTRTNM